jgi:hypothetical protein
VGQTQFRWLQISTPQSSATGNNYIRTPPPTEPFQNPCNHSRGIAIRGKLKTPKTPPTMFRTKSRPKTLLVIIAQQSAAGKYPSATSAAPQRRHEAQIRFTLGRPVDYVKEEQ